MIPAGLLMLIPVFIMIMGVAGLVVTILGLVEAVSRPDFKPSERIGWTLAIFFFQLMGVLVYLFSTDGKDLKTRSWLRNITILNIVMILLMFVAVISVGTLAFLMKH